MLFLLFYQQHKNKSFLLTLELDNYKIITVIFHCRNVVGRFVKFEKLEGVVQQFFPQPIIMMPLNGNNVYVT